MFLIYYISDTHSCSEDRSSAGVNMKHSEVPEIPREKFPGSSGRSWTVALAAVRLCSQPPWSRCTLPSSPPTHCSPMRIPLSTMTSWRVKNWTFLACVSSGTGHALSFLTTRWSTAVRAFITCRSVGSIQDADCICISPVEHRGKGEIVSLHKKDVGDVSLLLSWQIDWLFSSPLIRSHSLSRTNKIHMYFCQTNP